MYLENFLTNSLSLAKCLMKYDEILQFIVQRDKVPKTFA